MATRYDVSAVPPQGGYRARYCPVRAQLDVLRPTDPLPVSPVVERRMAQGIDFETSVLASGRSAWPEEIVIPAGAAGPEREALTVSAMVAEAPLIVGGRLPTDLVGRRAGEPDLLVRAASGGYRAVDIKMHRTLDPSSDPSSGAALCSPLASPGLETAAADPDRTGRRHRGDLLQLAHYQRMLEAAGFGEAIADGGGSDSGRWGGIVGTQGVIVWWNLDELLWTTPSSTGKQKRRSTMEIYDFEFDFRLDIMAVAHQHLTDPSVEPLVQPVRIGECGECPWWSHCGPLLNEGPGCVSLIPRSGWLSWKAHHEHGVTDRAQLAALDYRTARLVSAGVDLRPLIDAVGRLDDAMTVANVIGARKTGQIAKLAAAGIATVRRRPLPLPPDGVLLRRPAQRTGGADRQGPCSSRLLRRLPPPGRRGRHRAPRRHRHGERRDRPLPLGDPRVRFAGCSFCRGCGGRISALLYLVAARRRRGRAPVRGLLAMAVRATGGRLVPPAVLPGLLYNASAENGHMRRIASALGLSEEVLSSSPPHELRLRRKPQVPALTCGLRWIEVQFVITD